MTKLALTLVIACGIVVGNLAWELIGLMFDGTGRAVGWVIKQMMQQQIAARQEAAEVLARQRSPIVRETGGEVR